MFQKGVNLKNNYWYTNLDKADTLFGIDYTGSSYENELFEPNQSFKLRREISHSTTPKQQFYKRNSSIS